MKHGHEAFFGLRLEPENEDVDPHVISAQTLVRALEGLQRAVHLVAMMHEGQELKSKPQATRHIKRRFHLHVRPPVTGSYYQELLLTPQDGGAVLDFGEEAQVKSTLEDALSAIDQGDLEKFQNTIPNPEFQRPLIASFKKTLSDPSNSCRIKIEDCNGTVISDSDSVSEKIDVFKTLRSAPNIESFATGYVEKIDFYKRILFIRIPHTGSLLQCHYKKKVEDTLIENKCKLVQIKGKIEMNREGNPQKIAKMKKAWKVDTENINVIDLLPSYLEENHAGGLQFNVDLTDDKQAFVARLSDLGIFQIAHTRRELAEILEAELDVLWQEYALKDDENLVIGEAHEIKRQMKILFKEADR